ncbi:hypothetical protein GCM10023324_63390 [Streptomyces youssoufiensis]
MRKVTYDPLKSVPEAFVPAAPAHRAADGARHAATTPHGATRAVSGTVSVVHPASGRQAIHGEGP